MAGLLACCPAWSQSGTTPRQKAADYPVHGQAGELGIGAEYLVRSFGGGQHSFFIPDHLVVELALFPPKGGAVQASEYRFALRLNGKKKETLYAESPGMVAAALKYPDWERKPNLEIGAGAGNAGVVIGRPRPVGRFPGDRREPVPPPGTPPKTPTNTSGVEKQPPQTAAEAAVEYALPGDEFRGPVSGYVFFPYRGKAKSIQSLELILRLGERETVLRLF